MTHEDLNPFAAPGSNTSTDSTTFSFRDLFKGSLKSILDGPEGALRTGLRITLAALLFGFCFSALQSLLVMSFAAKPVGSFFTVLRITGIAMAAGTLGEFVGVCFLWKGMPQQRTLASCCCGILLIQFLLNYLLPRILSVGDFGVASFIAALIFGVGFTIARLLLLKQLTKDNSLHTLAIIAIVGSSAMTLVSAASFYWQVSLGNPMDFSTSTGKLIHIVFLFAFLVTRGIEIRIVYRVLCERLTTSGQMGFSDSPLASGETKRL